MSARLIQLIAAVVLVICTTVCGLLLPPILEETETHGLRYTDVSVEGAPPFVALGTAIGALRGLIVDYLWIKVHIMKEKGLFYEVMADAELITKLQPRFAAVWAFHGHNMAYNISVATHTLEERWEWVNAGIRLVRNEGIRYNPNDLELHKELAFWFAHKIEGVADDAHLYYKRAFTREWHFVLGEPPEALADRVAWMQAIADAPRSIEEAERRTPGVKALVTRFDNALTPFGETQRFRPDSNFLLTYGMWEAVKQQSEAAQILGVERQMRSESPFFSAFDEIASDPALTREWTTLINFVKRKVLVDEYNMDPAYMAEFTRDLGPIDWRHGQAHALYWSRRGAKLGAARVADEDAIYKMLNNDRIQLQAMQGLARYGRITFDPFSSELPSRFPEPRWIDTIEREFHRVYEKYYNTRGGGGESFIAFLQNFMGSAIRESYRSGEHERAQRLLDTLDAKFGTGATPPNNFYKVPLDVFVLNEVKGEYEMQPHVALSEAVAALRYAFREGVGRDRKEVYDQAVLFVNQVVAYFKGNDYNNYVTKFGEGRMKDLINSLESTKEAAFIQLMLDPGLPLQEKATIWANIDKYERTLRLKAYDQIGPRLAEQYGRSELSQKLPFEQLFPAPPGLELYREQLAAAEIARQKALEEQKKRDEIGRQE